MKAQTKSFIHIDFEIYLNKLSKPNRTKFNVNKCH